MDTATITTWPNLARRITVPHTPVGADAVWGRLAWIVRRAKTRRRRFLAEARKVVKLEKEFQPLTDAVLKQKAAEYRDLFRLGRQTRQQTLHGVALVREVARRVRSEHPYLVQVAGALAMIDGCVAEMATGEGKTLTASLAATLEGWRGRGCHVVTVNDYLASRDAESMRGVYEFCGLSVESITQDSEPADRKSAYLADVTYLTNKEATADFLRDRLAIGPRAGLTDSLMNRMLGQRSAGTEAVQRGLATAIVDEADSVLIDEAVTPLIISACGPNPEQAEVYVQGNALANTLESVTDYRVNQRYQEVKLTRAGLQKLKDHAKTVGGIWSGLRRGEELLIQALTAKEFYIEGKQYIIDDEKVVIVDEATGRLMPDREWRNGLHQAVTAKEGLEVEPPKDTCARISFQRFFQLYSKIAGMTGTAREGSAELWDIYRMPVVPIPTHRPCQRRRVPTRFYRKHNAKSLAIVDEVRRAHQEGQPVLVGTRSVKISNEISALLAKAELDHQVLNAVYHEVEAQIVAEAGQPGRITVATNMAGRGTDIKLGRGVADAHGLHVILTERHESRRVDRQLQGRCARQGDPGTIRDLIALDDELLVRHSRLGRWVLKFLAARKSTSSLGPLAHQAARWVYWQAQKKAGRKALAQRKSVLKNDTWLDEYLGFAGKEM
jgi:preprotein translocase subunit SecA